MAHRLVSVLKRQVPNDAGLYEWQRCQFVLNVEGGLIESDSGQPIVLSDARYAKEWALAHASAGFGFDVVLDSGAILSFLAPDEATCRTWVEAINECIAMHVDGDGEEEEDVEGEEDEEDEVDDEDNDEVEGVGEDDEDERGDEEEEDEADFGLSAGGGTARPPRYPSSASHQSPSKSAREDASRTLLVQQSPDVGQSRNASGSTANNLTRGYAQALHSPMSTLSPSPALPPAPHRQKGAKEHSQADAGLGVAGRPPAPLAAPYSSYSSSLASSPRDGVAGRGLGSGSGSGAGGSDAASHRLLEELMGAGSLLSQGGSRSLLGGSNAGPAAGGGGGAGLRASSSNVRELLLEKQSSRWQAVAEREAAEGAIAREQLVRVSAELEARQQQHKLEVERALERAAKENEALQSELEMRVIRASNENASFHELALRTEREQASRELVCLRDELQAERKRYAALLQTETAMRERAEGREVTLLQEIAGLKEQLARLSAETTRVKDTAAAEAAAFERERRIMQADHTARTARHEQEAADAAAKAQAELRLKHGELHLQFEARVKEIEASIRATIESEAENQRIRYDAAAKKSFAAELEAARLEERKARAREVEQVREAFREREKQTADDLAQLETLHNERVARLDAQNDALRQRVLDAEKASKRATAAAARSNDELKKTASVHLRASEENARRAMELAEQLSVAQRETQDSRQREAAYREQVARSLEETRVLRAEAQETRRLLQEQHQQTQVRFPLLYPLFLLCPLFLLSPLSSPAPSLTSLSLSLSPLFAAINSNGAAPSRKRASRKTRRPPP